MMNILIVSAHPDDEIIGMGATLKKLSKKNDIHILFLADGITARKHAGYVNITQYEVTKEQKEKMLREIEIRKQHAKKALSKLGVNKIKFLDLPDNELDTIPFLKIVKAVENEILLTKCETVFTHHYNDLNVDHRMAFEATTTATRPLPDSKISSVISFEVFSSTDWRQPYRFNPNLFIDVSSELQAKFKALREYRNEIRSFPHPRSIKALEAVARRWGSLYGFEAAEAFEIVMRRIKDVNKL